VKKNIMLFTILVFSSIITSAQESDIDISKLTFDPKYPLYIRDGSKFGFDEVDLALDRVYADQQPVVVFIHGRGNEPNKSLDKAIFVEGGAVRKIETHYKAKVLMFNWESKAFLYDRTVPLSHMKESADSLAIVLQKMSNYFAAHPKLKRPTLIVHSMGSIVLETYVKKYGWFSSLKTALFSKVMFTSPDADNLNHWMWLNEVGRVEKVYLTINKNDDILEKSKDERPNGVAALGRVPVLPFSDNITYLDLTDIAGGVHEAFNKENMKSQLFFCQIFENLVKGDDPLLSQKNVQATPVSNYFKVKSKVSKKDPCFNF
jgi:hypothetical protein